MTDFLVLPDDFGIRPAGNPYECFYCRQKVGAPHKHECVMIVQDTIYDVYVDGALAGTYTREDPVSWDADNCEFHKNDSSWCSANAVHDSGRLVLPYDILAKLKALAEEQDRTGTCTVCPHLSFKFKERTGDIRRAK